MLVAFASGVLAGVAAGVLVAFAAGVLAGVAAGVTAGLAAGVLTGCARGGAVSVALSTAAETFDILLRRSASAPATARPALAYGLGIRSRAASPSTVYALAVAASAWMTPPVSASSGMRSGLRLLAAVSWARARSSAARPCAVGFVAALSERTPAARAASSLETTGGRPL